MATKKRDPRLPKKKRLREIADRLWSHAVRADWAGKCAMCGSRNCEAHHLLPRQLYGTRYMLENGIALCPACHQWDSYRSPHQNADGFWKWLLMHHPKVHQWYIDANSNRLGDFHGTKTDMFYIEWIGMLRDHVAPYQFEGIVGVKFLDFLNDS